MASASELTYTLEGASLGLREDGRGLLDYRHCSVDVGVLPQASGSCRLRTGGTELLVGIVATLATPDALAPELGRITVSVGCGPGDTVFAGLPDYDALAQGMLDAEGKRLWIEAALRQLYGPRSVPAALRTLCIVPGRQCWELKAHVQLIRADGCPLDAAALALRAALHDTRVPKVAVAASSSSSSGGAPAENGAPPASAGGRLDLDLDETLDDSVPFDAAALPLYVTLCHLGGHLLADCSAKERKAAGSALSLALNADGSVVGLLGGGGFGLHMSSLAAAMTASRALCVELHSAAAVAIAEAAEAAAQRGGAAASEGVGFARN